MGVRQQPTGGERASHSGQPHRPGAACLSMGRRRLSGLPAGGRSQIPSTSARMGAIESPPHLVLLEQRGREPRRPPWACGRIARAAPGTTSRVAKRTAALLRDGRSVPRPVDSLTTRTLSTGEPSLARIAGAKQAVERLVLEVPFWQHGDRRARSGRHSSDHSQDLEQRSGFGRTGSWDVALR